MAASKTSDKTEKEKAERRKMLRRRKAAQKATRDEMTAMSREHAAPPPRRLPATQTRRCLLLRQLHRSPFDYDERHVYAALADVLTRLDTMIDGVRSDAQSGALFFESDVTLSRIDRSKSEEVCDVKDFLRVRIARGKWQTYAAASRALAALARRHEGDASWSKRFTIALDRAALIAQLGSQSMSRSPALAAGEEIALVARRPMDRLILRAGSYEIHGLATFDHATVRPRR